MIRDVIANFDGSLNGSPFRVRPCDLNEEIPFPVALQEDASLEGCVSSAAKASILVTTDASVRSEASER